MRVAVAALLLARSDKEAWVANNTINFRTRSKKVPSYGYLVATVVCGVIGLSQMASARGIDVVAFPSQSIPIWAAVGTAVFSLGAMLVSSRGRRVPVPRYFRLIAAPDSQRAVELVSALEPREQDKLLDQRHRAIAPPLHG